MGGKKDKPEIWRGWVIRPAEEGGWTFVRVTLPRQVVDACKAEEPKTNTRQIMSGTILGELANWNLGRMRW